MDYITAEYYTDNYVGLDPTNSNLATYIKRASDIIDMLTAQKIVNEGYDSFYSYQQDLIQKATAAQTEFFIENGETYTAQPGESGVNNVKLGRFSYNNATGSETKSLIASISVMAKSYLEQAGLICRGANVIDNTCYIDQKFANDCDCN